MPFKIFSDFESSLSLKVSLLKSKPKVLMIYKGKEAYCINHRAMFSNSKSSLILQKVNEILFSFFDLNKSKISLNYSSLSPLLSYLFITSVIESTLILSLPI